MGIFSEIEILIAASEEDTRQNTGRLYFATSDENSIQDTTWQKQLCLLWWNIKNVQHWGGVVEGKWRQLYLNNNLKKLKEIKSNYCISNIGKMMLSKYTK